MGRRQKIEFIVRGVLRNAGGQILLCRNIKGGYRYLPGGHIEFGEPAAAALTREFKEETGLTVRPGSLLIASENAFGDGDSMTHEMNLVFRVEHVGGPGNPDLRGPVTSQEKKLAFDWMDQDRLAHSDNRPAGLMRWLTQAKVDGIADWLSEIQHRRGG